jgi:hypothetical protein
MYRDQPGNLQGLLRDHLMFRDQPGTQGPSNVQGPARETTGNTQGSSTLPEPPRENQQGPPGKNAATTKDYSLYSTRTEPRRDHLLLRDQPGNLFGPPRAIYRDHQKTIADTIQDKFTGTTADFSKLRTCYLRP